MSTESEDAEGEARWDAYQAAHPGLSPRHVTMFLQIEESQRLAREAALEWEREKGRAFAQGMNEEMGPMSSFREAILRDAGETNWIDVEVVAYPERNPGLTEEIRARSGASGRSHSLRSDLALVLTDEKGWRRVLTRYESWAVMDVLAGLQVVRSRLPDTSRGS